MKTITRKQQASIELMAQVNAGNRSSGETLDSLYDGIDIPREISVKNWLYEEDVHKTKILASNIDSTRYFTGPQVAILRDDNRRTSWAAYVESGKLILCKIFKEQIEKRVIATGIIWRYHLALNKFTGE